MQENRRLRFGVMCAGLNFPEWQARCLRALLDLGYAEPCLLIVDSRPALPASSVWKRLSRLARFRINFFSLFNRYYVQKRCLATRPVDVRQEFGKLPRLNCNVIRKGKFSEYFSPEDLNAIRHYDLDFILRFGFGIIRGEVLSIPRYGVWSYHHGDEQKYRGAPPSFWEIYEGNPRTGAILQRLTERLDGGVVLKRGDFPTVLDSYPKNRDCAHFQGVRWPAEVCQDLQAGQAAYLEAAPSKTSAPIYLLPTNLQMLKFGYKVLWNRLARPSGSAELSGVGEETP